MALTAYETYTRPAGPTDAEINRELAAAMQSFGATQVQLKTADATRPLDAYETLRQLGADSELLRIVGSLGDTLDDEELLDYLRRWNIKDFPNG